MKSRGTPTWRSLARASLARIRGERISGSRTMTVSTVSRAPLSNGMNFFMENPSLSSNLALASS